MSRSTVIPGWVVLAIALVALVASTAAITVGVVGRSPAGTPWTMMGGSAGMMGGSAGMMGGSAGMMGGSAGMMGGSGQSGAAQPGSPGFVPGTAASPRMIRVIAGPGYAFSPATIAVVEGETVTFLVTAMGPTVHEFMVGPADDVAADVAGTPEIADISMMSTKSLTFTFHGPGPYAFACHAAGHYEAGMRGTITVVR